MGHTVKLNFKVTKPKDDGLEEFTLLGIPSYDG